jgi:hypothetical protein
MVVVERKERCKWTLPSVIGTIDAGRALDFETKGLPRQTEQCALRVPSALVNSM